MYSKLAKDSGITIKTLSSFKNRLALEAAIKFLEDGQEKPTEKPNPVKVKGNYVKLTAGDRTKLRRLAKEGKVKHPWGGKWELTKADYDRLMGGASAS